MASRLKSRSSCGKQTQEWEWLRQADTRVGVAVASKLRKEEWQEQADSEVGVASRLRNMRGQQTQEQE
jgi:hypothetical protein